MNRRFFIGLAALLAGVPGASRPCFAGKILFETSVKNNSRDVADGFTATLEPNGLFYKWAGHSAMLKGGKIFANSDEPDLFTKSPADAQSSFTVKSFENQDTVASQGYMIFSGVRNNVNLDKTKTMYLSATLAVPTAFGKAVKSKAGDPVVDITNSTGSAIQLLSANVCRRIAETHLARVDLRPSTISYISWYRRRRIVHNYVLSCSLVIYSPNSSLKCRWS
jgi:hypothetical protein